MAYPTSSIDQAIRTRLLSLQSSFFQSLQSGTDALAAFCQELTGFHEAVSSCEPNLQDETCRLIYSFAQTCTAVIPGLIDLNIASEKVIQEEGDEFYKLLDRMMLDDATCMDPETTPLYIQPAHIWLLDNLHNPYPSKQTRITLSKQTNTPRKDIDSWFIDIRKRIGWNSLRKKHFSTRKDMIAAATRFFKPSFIPQDLRTAPQDTTESDQKFALLEDNAKNLYSRKFSASTLANELATMKDVAPEANSAGQGNLARQMSNQEIETIPNSPYTSPEFVSPSSLTFSSPSPPPSQPSSQGRKRRQSDSNSNSGIETRPCKRTRNNASVDLRGHSSLPSTQSDAKQHSPSFLDSSPSTPPINFTPISEGSRKRKRQSSDSDSEDDQGRMKRAHCIPSSPSNSLVEPLPSGPSNSVDLDQWIKSLCGEGIDLGHSIPEPVYETSLLTDAVEIDCYRYASSSPPSSVSSPGPSTPPDYNTDFPAASHQSLSWPEPPLLTKVQGYDGSENITSELLSTNWSEEGFLFDLDSPSNADFASQNWDLELIPAISANGYSTSQIRQEVVDKSIQPWTNEEPVAPISFPGLSNQLSPLTSFSDNSDDTALPQVFQHPSKGAKIRYLQTLLNEVQSVRLDLAL